MIHDTPASARQDRLDHPATGHRSASRPTATLTLGAVVALAAAIALSLRLVRIAPTDLGQLAQVDQLIELGALAIGSLVAWWLAVGIGAAAVCSIARGVGRRWSAGERYVAHHAPTVVRRLLAASIGAGVGLTTAMLPAGAQPAEPPPDLGWVATAAVATDAATGAATDTATDTAMDGATAAATGLATDAPTDVATIAAPHTPAPAPEPAPAPAPPPPDRVTVAPGDSLWAIAARRLGPDATAADIAAAWPTWYTQNRAVVGADPDQIRIGDVLVAPTGAQGTGPGAAS